MSRTFSNESWGPRHQQPPVVPAKHRSIVWKALGWYLVALFAHGVIDPAGPNMFEWSAHAVVMGWLTVLFVRGVRDGRIPIGWLLRLCERLALLFVDNVRASTGRRPVLDAPVPTAEYVRARVRQAGGGPYLGVDEDGEWVTADPRSATMVLGPPQRGKTSAVIIPALLGASGAVISTSTKPDVMEATFQARAELGELWLFDPYGEEQLPVGVQRLCWSPVAGADTWDRALIMARAMTACTRVGAGTSNENHWTERAAALLAPLLFAANASKRPIEEVLCWTLDHDLAPALKALQLTDAKMAASVLVGIERTDTRERSSIFSATAGVLAAYNSDAVRATATEPNFDPFRFAASHDTLYITAPEQHQAACAPLIVGLLEQIRHAAYDLARRPEPGRVPMLWLLDEVANIAPIHDLPNFVSQAGGQLIQLLIVLQDLSQAATRWGQHAAEGFMSLFQTKLILDGIGDPRTLEAISLAIGEYDRELVCTSSGTNENGEWFSLPGRSEGTSYQTHRQRVLPPGEIAQLPKDRGLLLEGASWELIELTRWYQHDPWTSIGG
ncbi:MAG: type IV secretory system conjugative DNA transfer family protein [Solirubrobacteraceae bacterium]